MILDKHIGTKKEFGIMMKLEEMVLVVLMQLVQLQLGLMMFRILLQMEKTRTPNIQRNPSKNCADIQVHQG